LPEIRMGFYMFEEASLVQYLQSLIILTKLLSQKL
jgi:hypothetical protein